MAPPPSSNKKAPPQSKSRDLVPVGPREVVGSRKHHAGSKRDENGNKPTTARALILRNGKHGAMGTGELVSTQPLSGREKLDLLAEDLMNRYAQALATPFSAERAVKIAEAQFLDYADEIQDLQDPELFKEIIEVDVLSRYPPGQSTNKKNKPQNPLNDPTKVATVVSSRIHNAYMLASAWRLTGSILTDMVDSVSDSEIKATLEKDTQFRAQYLVLYDLVNIIADVNQQKFALLATSAPHWSQYFKPNTYKSPGDDQPEYVFDWGHLKSMHKSFLDSIVVELCLPQSPIPKQILLNILSEAIDETPRDAKRFPQALWDAMGDLASTVQLQELLESPLLGEQGVKWKSEPRVKPEDYLNWEDAQIFSVTASKEINTFKEFLVPLSRTKEKHIMETIWKFINLNYQGVSGQTIDELWGLNDLKNRAPTWHAYHIPGADKKPGDADADGPPSLVQYGGKKGAPKAGSKKPLAITSGYDSSGSMPSLQTVSDSSDEDIDFEDDEGDSDEEEESDDDDEEYDEEFEDHIREWIRDAMDIAQADPDFNDPRSAANVFEDMSAEKKDNPFLKLLGSLRGRLFSGSAAMKTTDRAEPRKPYTGPKPPPSAYKPAAPSKTKPAAPKAAPKPKTTQPKSQAATVEEVSDEEEPTTSAKKKKKKPKKKKKKAAPSEATLVPEEALEQTPAPAPEPAPAPAPEPAPATPAAAQKKAPAKQPPAKAPSVKSVSASVAYASSTTSLPLPTEQTAQSARTYLKSEGLDAEKTKVKTRADHGNLFSIPEKKKGLFSRFTREKAEKPEVDQEAKFSMFSNLSKRAKTYMHQLLSTTEDEKRGLAPMKWDHFVKVMTEMGFTYVPSTAGSSVRFDPPDPKDPPVTFHKPHPDSTIGPVMLKEFGKKLKRRYGWEEEDFYKRMS